MKTLPFWMGLIEDKAIIIAAFAESVYKVARPGNLLTRYIADNSISNSFHTNLNRSLQLSGVRNLHLRRLHPVSIAFIIAEFLDLLTTMVGLLVIPKIWEANPIVGGIGGWIQTVFLKMVVVTVVVCVIELMRRPLKIGSITLFSGKLPKAIWIIPVVAGLPVLWNNLVIIMELVA